MLKVSSSEDRSSVRNTVCLCAWTLPDLPTFACFSLVSDFQHLEDSNVATGSSHPIQSFKVPDVNFVLIN